MRSEDRAEAVRAMLATKTWTERLALWVAFRLPRSVVYWATIRLAAEAIERIEGSGIGSANLGVFHALRAWRGPTREDARQRPA